MYEITKSIDAHVHLTSLLMGQDMFMHKDNVLEADCLKACIQMMDKHGIDQCLGIVGQGISMLPLENDMQIKMAEALPDRIAGVLVGFSQPKENSWDYDPIQAALEIENYMKNPIVKGWGEISIVSIAGPEDWMTALERLRPTLEVLAAHKAVALFHTGPMGSFSGAMRQWAMGSEEEQAVTLSPQNGLPTKKNRMKSGRALYWSNPIWIDDIAEEYPEIPIIIGHCGVQCSFFYGSFADVALMLAARHENVYLETSSAPYEVLEKAVYEPSIGPEKLIFGTDTPAFFSHYTAANGEHYPSYGKTGPGDSMPDHYKYDIDNINRLPITEREKAMIMGGTLARLLSEKVE